MVRALDDYIDDVLRGVIDSGPRGRFSTEDVRNAINDKHNLHLLPDDDGGIGRVYRSTVLRHRSDAYAAVARAPSWSARTWAGVR
jgi:hypothetical protein